MSIEKNTYYSKRYNPPRKFPAIRKPILYIFFATLIFFGLDLFAGTKFFAGEGPLSSAHSMMNGECQNCHTQNWTRSNNSMELQCTRCHEDNKPLKFHLAAYKMAGVEKREVKQVFCMDCHQEHRGHKFRPVKISDQQCRNCHEIQDAGRDHPEFKSAKLEATQMASIGLQFSHLSHQKNDKNSEKVNKKFEKGCFLCHKLDPTKGFQDFSRTRFNDNCKDCHQLQELMLTWMFEADQLDDMAESIQGLVQKFGFEPYNAFLSRFEYRKANKRRRRPAAFKYSPVHQDPYLQFWFSDKEGIEDRVKVMLSQGKKGMTLNCLKCHVVDESTQKDKSSFRLSQNVSLRKVAAKPKQERPMPAKFFHKKHAGQDCDTCHTKILQSKSLLDENIKITKTSCFNCHNKQKVDDNCSCCHSFHQPSNQETLTNMLATRGNKLKVSRISSPVGDEDEGK
jgi:hypothetical protein